MNIRPATRNDSDALVGFNLAMALETEGKHLDRDVLSRGVEAVFGDEKKGFYLVAEDEGHVVGSLMVTYEWSDWRNGWFWWIQSVYIPPEHRGRRIYSQLYSYLKQRAAEAGNVCGFRLYAETENHHAHEVYKKVGMEAPHYVMFEECL